MATFSIHYDGPITIDHKVSLRVMARTYDHMQRAIDRAYLINVHGNVWKHARLKKTDYAHTDFIAAYPEEGGIILKGMKDFAEPIIDRIGNAIAGPYERALNGEVEEAVLIAQEIQDRKEYVNGMGINTRSFTNLLENPPAQWAEQYSDRSILKEIDQLSYPLASSSLEGSSLDLDLHGVQNHPTYHFSGQIAKNFHSIVSRRELGPAAITRIRIRDLDRGNDFAKPKAKIVNLDSTREVTLHLSGNEDVANLHPYHMLDQVSIFACPFIEGGGFDVMGGDLYFIGIAEQA